MVYTERFPNRSFGILDGISAENDENNIRVCCLYRDMKTQFDNLKNTKRHYLHARLPRDPKLVDHTKYFTLADIIPRINNQSLMITDKHWGLMSAIFAFLIRTKTDSAFVWVPNNGRVSCFSTLFMIEMNMLRLPENTVKMNTNEKKAFKKKVEKYIDNLKKGKATTKDNPNIKSFPVEIEKKANNGYVEREDNKYDIGLDSQFYDAETVYQSCAEKRGTNSMEDDEYRR